MMKRDHNAEMADLERQYEAGNKRVMLVVIYACICSYPEKPVPLWAKQALAKALYDIGMAKTATWDNVLGRPHPRRKLPQLRKQREVQWPLFKRVMELRSQRPKPRGIYDMVAKEFGVEPATAKRYFDHVRKNWFSKSPIF